MGTSYGPYISTGGTIAYCVDAASKRSYPRTGTNWKDLVSKTDGTLNNGPMFDVDSAGIFVLDGANDYQSHSVNFPIINPTNGITMCLWTKIDYEGGSCLLSYHKPSTNNGIRIQFNMDKLTITYGGVADHHSTVSKASIVDGQWKNICVSILGTTATFYVDGDDRGIVTVGTADITDLSEITISKYAFSSSGYFDGAISNASIYNRALSSREIKQNYNTTVARFLQYNDTRPRFE